MLLLAACGNGPPTCTGGGPLHAEIGERVGDDFRAFSEGDAIPVRQDGGSDALRLDYEIGGLDTTSPVTVVVRIAVDGGSTEDFLASASLDCTEGEPATYRAWAAFPGGLESGQDLRIQSAFTDALGTGVESDIRLRAVDGGSETTR